MLTKGTALLITFFLAGVFTCVAIDDKDDKPVLPPDTLPTKLELDRVPVGFENAPKSPAENPLTAEKVELGRQLFFDPILSEDNTVSCASCHQPEHGFASPEDLPIGLKGQRGRRNAPSILNRAYGSIFSWDGRDESLEQQVLGPLTSETEMGSDVDAVIKRLQANNAYVDSFSQVFGNTGAEPSTDNISTKTLAQAIAAFERTLLSGNSAVDRFRASDYNALSLEARQGLWIFESRGQCWKCHSGPNFTNEDFHNTGVQFGNPKRDEGRFEHTKDPNDKFKFKTPTLRDIEHTGPYMHDGSLKTLREVVEFYNKGGNPDDPNLDEDMKPLKLSEDEIGFVVEFLKALSGEQPE